MGTVGYGAFSLSKYHRQRSWTQAWVNGELERVGNSTRIRAIVRPSAALTQSLAGLWMVGGGLGVVILVGCLFFGSGHGFQFELLDNPVCLIPPLPWFAVLAFGGYGTATSVQSDGKAVIALLRSRLQADDA